MVLAIGLGLGTLFVRFPLLHEIIKYVGAAYLLYLAWKIARAHASMKAKKIKKPLTFIQALLFQWVNPKAWVMAVGVVSAYTTNTGHVLTQVVIISMIYTIFALLGVGTWFLSGRAMQRLLKNDKHQAWFNYSVAGLLVISIALIFME